MQKLVERFLRYTAIDTTSLEGSGQFPSTPNQLVLGKLLAQEMQELGLDDVEIDEYGYVFGTIPKNCEGAPALGLLAHMDTSPAAKGQDIHPRIIDYTGGDILLNKEPAVIMSPADHPQLNACIGKALIVTDGTTLLGADDKAGIAEIMTLAERLMAHPEIPHGKIRIGFTPDEEIGIGTSHFSVERFGAEIAYTVDGGPLGEIEYESFNAATARISINGISVHTGSAKGKMKNALLLAHEFQAMLPPAETPAHTEGYEGFYHLRSVTGGVENCRMIYNIREHDEAKYEAKKKYLRSAAAYMNQKYGEGTVVLDISDSYKNMKSVMKDHMELIEHAKDAFLQHHVTPITPPIRGGTDGARLSFMGLPCPNLSTGGYNFHGRFEFIPVESMMKMVDVLETLVSSFVSH